MADNYTLLYDSFTDSAAVSATAHTPDYDPNGVTYGGSGFEIASGGKGIELSADSTGTLEITGLPARPSGHMRVTEMIARVDDFTGYGSAPYNELQLRTNWVDSNNFWELEISRALRSSRSRVSGSDSNSDASTSILLGATASWWQYRVIENAEYQNVSLTGYFTAQAHPSEITTIYGKGYYFSGGTRPLDSNTGIQIRDEYASPTGTPYRVESILVYDVSDPEAFEA
jgi:hypothetical protein